MKKIAILSVFLLIFSSFALYLEKPVNAESENFSFEKDVVLSVNCTKIDLADSAGYSFANNKLVAEYSKLTNNIELTANTNIAERFEPKITSVAISLILSIIALSRTIISLNSCIE